MIGVGLSIPQIAGSSTAYSPAYLFAAGEVGAWYDPSDLSTLFQDSAGTTPVTAVDQPIGRMLDKSGNGNHATQTSDTSRPLLKQDAGGRYYLLFDGSNDSLFTGSVNFSNTDKVSVFTGLRKLSDVAQTVLVELGNGTGNGVFNITSPRSTGAKTFGFVSRGTILADAITPASYTAPLTVVLACSGSIGGDTAIIRVNGSQQASITTDQGTGNYQNAVLNIGRRNNASLPFNGSLYSLIVRGAATSASDVSKLETWVNGKTGAY